MSYTIPMFINVEAWEEWCEYRQKARKKKVSEFAAKKQFKTLLKYTEEQQQQIIDNSISNDYQGLFDLKGGTNENNQRPNQPRRSSVVDRAHAAADERERARQARANDGQVMAEVAGGVRSSAQQPVRGDDTRELGTTFDGTYRRTD